MRRSLVIHHRDLNACLANGSAFAPSNACLSDRQNRALSLTLAAAFLALDEESHRSEQSTTGDWPSTTTNEAFRDALVQHLVGLGVSSPLHGVKQGGVGEWLDRVAGRFFRSRRGKCPATVSVVGALASQEAIKGITGVHTPLQQMIFFESLDSLPENEETVEEYSGEDNMSRVYGQQLAEALRRQRLFVVGAGAIGCELLKNFALMGVATESSSDTCDGEENGSWTSKGLSKGGIVVADMDTIEKSNLNRQLLFRSEHIGMSKAETAAAVLRKINPRVQIKGINSKVSEESEVFDAQFWEGADAVVTALDNVDARRFVDGMCLRHRRCMLDSGTQGTKGNTQVIFPALTETYSASTDPADDSIPLCTLKAFPYLAEHCVAWAKSLFETLFGADVAMVRNALLAVEQGSVDDFLDSLSKDEIKRLHHGISMCSSEYSARGAIRWAFELFVDMFTTEVQALIAAHPIDEVDEFGLPFWSGSRKFPLPAAFDSYNEEHVSFLRAMATQQCRALGIDASQLEKEIQGTKFSHPRGLVNGSLEEMRSLLVEKLANFDKSKLKLIQSSLREQYFEKDDPSLGHVDLVAVAANIRCRVYGIRTIDRMDVQRIAGNIIPALATTTAVVAGLVSLELVKTIAAQEGIREPRLEIFRNAFVNLALPEVSFAEPVPAEVFSAGSETFTPWDVVSLPLGLDSLTIKALAKTLEKRFGVQLQSVAIGDRLLYADFLDDAEERFRMSVGRLMSQGEVGDAEELLSSIPEDKYVDLQVTCVDAEGEEVRLPPVRVENVKGASSAKSSFKLFPAQDLKSKISSFASRTKGSVEQFLRRR